MAYFNLKLISNEYIIDTNKLNVFHYSSHEKFTHDHIKH